MASLVTSSNAGYLLIVNKANGLRAADTLGKSDPYVKLTCPAMPTCLDEKTQVIQKNLNPVWGECFLVCLPPSIPPVIKLSVFDSDKGAIYDGTDDFLGQAGIDLNNAIADNPTQWHSVDLPLGGDKARGTLNVMVKSYVDPQITVDCAARLRNADGFFGKSDPYARLTGLTAASMNWGETKTVRDCLNPNWNETFTINLFTKMPMGGKLCPLKIELWDEDDKKRSSSDDPLGLAIVPWVSLFPDDDVPQLAPLKLTDRGAKSGSSVTIAVKAVRPQSSSDLGNIGRALLNAKIGGGPAPAAPTPVQVSAPIQKAPIKIAKTSCMTNLCKGVGFKIADCTDNIADKYTLGLAWDVTNGVNIDLDASCVFLDATLQPIDTVWFQKLRSADGSMQHCGDEREGDEVGDDESIMFDLEKVTRNAVYLCFCINSFTGQTLNNVSSAKCRMYNTETTNEVAAFNLTGENHLKCTALLMCILYRAGVNDDWYMYAVGEPAMGRTVQDNVDEFQAFLTKHPLANLPQGDKPTKMAKLQVPQSTGPNNTIGFKLPSGASEQVKLPSNVKAGDVVEVPMIDVFIA